MGEAKRRKTALGDQYGQEQRIVSWLPITKTQAEDFYNWTTKGAWIDFSAASMARFAKRARAS